MVDEEKAVHHAKQVVVLAIIAAVALGIILYIDMGIKKSVLQQAIKARDLLDEARRVAEEVTHGRPEAAEQAGSAAGAPVDAGNGVVRDAAAREVLDQARSDAKAAPARNKARVQDGAPGNG